MRIRMTILSLIAATMLAAQDDFYKVLERAQATTTPEGLYILMHYQQQNPKFAPIYFHLGNLSWQLAADQHPLREYNDLQQSLYRTRVFWGNCLHYAQGQSLKPQAYSGIVFKAKKPTYDDLKPILDSRLVEVTDAEQKAKNLYESYCRLAERYNRCRQLFQSFSETYRGEKNAHLYLRPEDRALLETLMAEADSLPQDIQALKQALTNRPIDDYNPHFHFQPINLYGLDGLTGANMMQNDVLLWDYAAWSRRFLKEHDGLYSDYYRAIHHEHMSLRRTMQQLEKAGYTPVKVNDIILNRIDRIDYGSPMKDWLALDQQTAVALTAPYDSLLHRRPETVDEDYRDNVLIYIYEQYNRLQQIRRLRATLQQADTTALRAKYGALLASWGDTTAQAIQVDVTRTLQRAEDAYRECCTLAYEGIHEAFRPFVRYTNEMTGEVMTADSLHYMQESELVAILPMGRNYLAVESNKKAVLTDENGQLISAERYAINGNIVGAVKLSGNTAALITEQEILFVDNQGKQK